ncbi:MAG: hypothetical protein K8T20_17810 [Planctomycetes bacterium]|nr:hypothetical protein [Planctomycetota bacterium]
MRLRPVMLASLLAFSARAIADDPDGDHAHPPGPPPDSAEAHFDEFMAAWRKIIVHVNPGTVRTFHFTAMGGPIDVAGKVEITALSPAENAIAFKKTLTLEKQEEIEGKRVPLPPVLSVKEWAEPLPILLPEHCECKIEKDMDLKVGEKTLKCTKLTLIVGEDKAAPDTVTTWWICDEEHLGLVRATAEAGKDRKMDMVLTGWKVPEK